jgi:iron-sulfur cluster assembly accessory protein
MPEQVGTHPDAQGILLSSAAAQAARAIMDEKELEGYGLRIYVAGSACSSMQFGMALDNNIREIDTAFESNGVKVIVDEISINYLRGASVDYIDDPQHGAGFIVNSPNARAHNIDGGSCTCGGSCACNN